MSLLYASGVPDEAFADEMTVFLDPLKTHPRYQPGVRGVAASMHRFESVVFGSDWQSTCSVLGDMAMCMNIECRDLPNGNHFDFRALQSLFGELEEVVKANDELAVRGLLREMLQAAGLIERTAQLALSA